MHLGLPTLPRKLFTVATSIALFALAACSTVSSEKHQNQEELLAAYLSHTETVSVDIVFERGHNSHRIHAAHRGMGPEIQIFHDKQVYKSLKIDEVQFKTLLTKSLETAGELQRKPATKANSPCRTPFVITVKNHRDTFAVEGCRGSEEGSVFGKLIAEIEYLASSSQVQ